MLEPSILTTIDETKDEKVRDLSSSISRPDVVAEARKRWIKYQPKPSKCNSVGIDGSDNKIDYKGFKLFAIKAVAVDHTNTKIPIGDKKQGYLFRWGMNAITPQTRSRMMTEFEILAIKQALQQSSYPVDLILCDGSPDIW